MNTINYINKTIAVFFSILFLSFAFSADPNWEGSFDGSAYEFTANLPVVFISPSIKT